MRNYYASGNTNIPFDSLKKAGMDEIAINQLNRQVEMTRGWTDALVPLGSLRTTGAGAPDLEEINSSFRWGYAMSDQHTLANEKRLFASAQLPHSVRRGSEIRFHIHYAIETAVPSTDRYVYWEIKHSSVNRPGQVLSSSTPTTVMYRQTLLANTPAYTYGIVTIATLIDENVLESSIYGAHLQRRSSDTVNDTYTGKIYIMSADAHIYVEKAGTFDEYPR